jgi:tetratricopeptide (TPR) repeat protein
LALFVGGAPFQAAAQVGDRTQYIVDGLALGDPVQPNSSTYRQYQCNDNDEFASFIWCPRRRTGNGKFGKFTSVNSILHSPDGVTAYVSRYIEPAFFGSGEVQREIERLSQLFGSRPRILESPRQPGEPKGVIAYWGDVALDPLEIASGQSVRKGMLFDFLGNFGRSAREGLPIFQLGGSSGYVWSARFDKNDWGSLRMAAIDAAQFTAPPLAAPSVNIAFSMDQCRNSKEPAVKIVQFTVVISQSTEPKIRERAFDKRGLAYMASNRFSEAASDFTAVIRLNPRIAGYYDNRQNALSAMGRLDDAPSDANRAVRLAPTYSFVYGSRGNVFADMGRFTLTFQDYATAISLDSKNAGLFVDRGKIFVKAGRLHGATADFTQALGIDMNMTAALRERGLAYKLLGNFDAARADLSFILRLQPNDGEIVQALQDMAPVTRRSVSPPRADEAVSFPALSGRVVDQATIIPPPTRASIAAKLAGLEAKSGIQFVVATVNSLQGEEIEPYATALFREWGLGERDKNNGLLLLVAPNQHRVRIEVGYGLEGTLTNAVAKIILSHVITPSFNTGDFGGGIERVVDDAITVLTNDEEPFDRPLSKKVIMLPANPASPQAKPALSCFYYPNFMVKEIDLGELGAWQLSIIPASRNYKETACRRQNIQSERVIDSDPDSGWSGYFRGVKGNYVFFDAEDGWEGGMPFAIYDGINGQKIFHDAIQGDFQGLLFRPTSITMKYKRIYLSPCSMRADETGCWQKIQQETGLLNATAPDCRQAYRDALDAEIARRPSEAEKARTQEIIEDPTVLKYTVNVEIENGQKTITALPDKIECSVAE